MKTKLKKTLCVLLAVIMTVSLSAPAFAAGESVYRYVALGDSATNGYGLQGFNYSACGRYSMVEETYICRTVKYLEAQGKTVDFKNLALTGMRINELVDFLDPETRYEDLDPYGQMRWEEYSDGAYKTPEELHETYISAISEADLITLDLGSNNFANYLLARVAEMFGIDIGFRWGYADDHFNDLMAENGFEISLPIRNRITALVEQVTDGAVSEDMTAGIVDALLYAYAKYAIGFDQAMEYIYGYNDDVEVIVLGISNLVDGITVSLGDVVVDFGAIYGAFMAIVNEYLISVSPFKDRYEYADLSGGVESILQGMSRGVIYPELCDEIINLFYADNMLGSQAAGEYIGALAGVSYVSAAEARQAYRDQTPSQLTDAVNSVMDTFIKAANYTDPIPLDELINVLLTDGINGLSGLFYEVFDDFDSASTIAKSMTHIMFYMMKNSAGAHPSAYGHEQKLNAVIKTYEAHILAQETHLVSFIGKTVSFIQKLFKSPDWLGTIRTAIRDFFTDLIPVKFC